MKKIFTHSIFRIFLLLLVFYSAHAQTPVYDRQWGGVNGGAIAVNIHPITKLVYVCNAFDYTIKIYNKAGILQQTLGGFGTGDGQFNVPEDIAFDAQGNFYVSDIFNHRVQKFDANNNFIKKWGN